MSQFAISPAYSETLLMNKRTFPLLIPFLVLTLSCLLIACQATPAADDAEVTTAQVESVEVESAVAEQDDVDADGGEQVDADADDAEHDDADSEEVEHVDVDANEVESAVADADETEPIAADPEEAEQAEAPTEAQEAAIWVTSEIRIPGADDQKIAATLTAPEGGQPVPAVLLLHMLGSSQQAWLESDLLTELQQNGYATLTIDMRGHGATGGINDWDRAEIDHLLVWQYLRDLPQIDGQATAVIGASIGANMALRLGASVPQIDTVVLLSPGLEYRGVTSDDALANYGPRPIFYAAARGDSYADSSVTALADQSTGPKQLEKLEGSAHGTQMLTAEPALSEKITAWLDQHVATGDPEPESTDGA